MELKHARLTLTLNSSVHTQPMIICSMPLEPHCNSDFKTGAGIQKALKNPWVMAQKLNVIWNPNCWVFWAIHIKILANPSSFSADASSVSKNWLKMIPEKSWKPKICVCCSAECQTCLQIQLHLSAVSAGECQKCLKIHLNLSLVLALAVRSTA